MSKQKHAKRIRKFFNRLGFHLFKPRAFPYKIAALKNARRLMRVLNVFILWCLRRFCVSRQSRGTFLVFKALRKLKSFFYSSAFVFQLCKLVGARLGLAIQSQLLRLGFMCHFNSKVLNNHNRYTLLLKEVSEKSFKINQHVFSLIKFKIQFYRYYIQNRKILGKIQSRAF